MILRSKCVCVSASHVPESQYKAKSGEMRTRPAAWEVVVKAEQLLFSRATRQNIKALGEEILSSAVQMTPGQEYEVTLDARSFSVGEITLTITEAVPLNKAAK